MSALRKQEWGTAKPDEYVMTYQNVAIATVQVRLPTGWLLRSVAIQKLILYPLIRARHSGEVKLAISS